MRHSGLNAHLLNSAISNRLTVRNTKAAITSNPSKQCNFTCKQLGEMWQETARTGNSPTKLATLRKTRQTGFSLNLFIDQTRIRT